MRQRLEVIAAILAAGGAAFAVQQAFSVPGTWLAAGIYVAVAGGVLLLVASRQLGSSRATWPDTSSWQATRPATTVGSAAVAPF